MNATTYVVIRGEIHGPIWPGVHCCKPIQARVQITDADSYPYSYPPRYAGSVHDALAGVLNDGDFADAKFTPDTTVEIVREIRLPGGRIDVRNGHDVRAMSFLACVMTRTREVDLSKSTRAELYVSDCDGHYDEEEED